jgi:hypothetical protein
MELTIEADGQSIQAHGKMSRHGQSWEPDLQLAYRRVGQASRTPTGCVSRGTRSPVPLEMPHDPTLVRVVRADWHKADLTRDTQRSEVVGLHIGTERSDPRQRAQIQNHQLYSASCQATTPMLWKDPPREIGGILVVETDQQEVFTRRLRAVPRGFVRSRARPEKLGS